MDFQRVARTVAVAEQANLEGKNFTGLRLGELWECWPEEVLSGRCARGKSKSPECAVIKAYVKFAQAARDLEETVQLSGMTGALPPSVKVMPMSSLPTARALVLANTAEAVASASDGPFRVKPFVQFAEQSVRSNKIELQIQNLLTALQSQSHHVRPNVRTAAVQQPPTDSSTRWHSWIVRGVALLFFLAIPRIVSQLTALIAEKAITGSIAASAKVGLAASREFENAGGRVLTFLDDTLDVCFSEPTFSVPEEAPAVAVATAAASAAVQLLQSHANITDAASVHARQHAVEHTVAEVVKSIEQVKTQQQAVAHSNRLPGWMIAFVGIASMGMAHCDERLQRV